MDKPTVSVSSDYAHIQCGRNSFYYGYEDSICLSCGEKSQGTCLECDNPDMEWCFVAKIKSTIDPQEIIIPQSKLGIDDRFDVSQCLMAGMSILLTKYGHRL